MYQDRRFYGPHLFPLFRKWNSLVRKYPFCGIICVAWPRFPMRDSSLYFYIFVEDMDSLLSLT